MVCVLLQARDPVRNQVFIVAESRLPFIPGAVPKAKKGGGKAKEGAAAPKEGEGGWEVLSKMKGADLVGAAWSARTHDGCV
jgi:hypothetical protein